MSFDFLRRKPLTKEERAENDFIFEIFSNPADYRADSFFEAASVLIGSTALGLSVVDTETGARKFFPLKGDTVPADIIPVQK